MSPQPSARFWVRLATGVIVSVTAPILFLLMSLAFRTDSAREAGRLVALATLMVSGIPLVLRGANRARGGAPEGGAHWVWEVAIVVVAALLFLFARLSSPPVIYDGCGLSGELCTKAGNFSPAQPDGPADDVPPSTPPLTR